MHVVPIGPIGLPGGLGGVETLKAASFTLSKAVRIKAI